MGGQGIQRREILRILSIAAGAATFPGFSKWSFACGHVGHAVQIKPAAYQPSFFTAEEFGLVNCLTDIIIPTDSLPGARDAGVAEFIDLMVSRDVELQHDFRNGLAWLNAYSKRHHHQAFLNLTTTQQTSVLEPLAYKAKHRKGDEAGHEFFDLFREYTVMGFYTTEIGLKQLDFPGLRFYAQSPACPHTDDRAHLHLPAPQF
jgi:gluconate 2-dehydrogenase gamma chain